MAALRRIAPFAVAAALVAAVSLWTLAPRLSSTFPSMVDDWYAISRSPDQLRDALTLRMTEEQRYRPGWVAWNALQWHTLGGPEDLRPARAWGVARALVLVLGLVAAGTVVVSRGSARRLGGAAHAALAGGAALVVVTIPGFAVDLARYGPQEPLLVGLMCGGAALMTVAFRRSLAGRSGVAGAAALGGLGALAWAAGVAQKETSVAVLALVPFLWLAVRDDLPRFRALPPGLRRTLLAVLAIAGLALVPMLARTVQLTVADERVYDAEPTEGLVSKTLRQIERLGADLGSQTGWALAVAAVAAVVVVGLARRVDWLAVGLLLTALGFLVLAAQTEIAFSRYYLPTLALAALVIVRAAALLPVVPAAAAAVALIAVGVWQAPDARALVDEWVVREAEKEDVVRATAQRAAGGCPFVATGNEVELVDALPVLVPLAVEDASGCARGDRFVVVLSSSGSDDSGDPLVRACSPGEVAFENAVGRILRCSG